jgi:Tol biopolymer transport system component
VSENGTLAYVPGGIEQNQHRLVWVSRTGMEQTLPAPVRTYEVPRISPDGRRVAVGSGAEGQIMVYDLQRGTLTRFTFDGRNNAPAWTPDGKRIAFASTRTGVTNSFWQLADGSGGLEQLTSSQSTSNTVHSFTPDGKIMAFRDVNPTTGGDIWILRLDEPLSSSPSPSGQGGRTRKAEPFLRSPFNEGSPRFSPDGHWLAYISDESGRYEVYVQPYPGPGGKYQISTEGGMEPVWNPKGRELFYRSNNNKMMAVEVSTQPNFAVGTPKPLFDGEYVYSPASWSNYDVSPDGQRFLMIKPTDAVQAPSQIVVVQNWFEELKRRVPTGTK